MTVAQTDSKVVSQTEVAGTAPKAVKATKAAQRKAEEDETDEPAVRKEANGNANVPKASADLSKIVDAWDDETDD